MTPRLKTHAITLVLTLIFLCLTTPAIASFLPSRLSEQINQQWQTLTPLDQRYASVRNNAAIINNEAFRADALLTLQQKDLKALLSNALKERLNAPIPTTFKSLSAIKIIGIDFELVAQGLIASLAAQVTIEDLDIEFDVTLSGEVSVIVDEKGFLLEPALTQIHIKAQSQRQDILLGLFSASDQLLTDTSSHFQGLLAELNRVLFDRGIQIPYRLHFAETFSPQSMQLVQGFQISGKDISLATTFPQVAVLISNRAITVIASSQSTSEPDELQASESINQQTFNKAYAHYRDNVEKLIAKSFGDDYQPELSSALISNPYIAKTLNQALNNVDIRISGQDFLQIPKPDAAAHANRFRKDIRLHDKQLLPHCAGLSHPASRAPCHYSCSWSRPDRCARKAACEAANQSRWLAQQTENEARIAECQTERQALILENKFVKLGAVEGEYRVSNSQLEARISGIYFSEQLNEVSIQSSLQASIDASLKLALNPAGFGHMVCLLGFNDTLYTHARYNNPRLDFSAKFSGGQDNTGKPALLITTAAMNIQGTLTPPPYQELLDNPGLLFDCTFLTMAIPTLAGTHALAGGHLGEDLGSMLGHLNIDLHPQELPISLKPIAIGKHKNSLELHPRLGHHALIFTL